MKAKTFPLHVPWSGICAISVRHSGQERTLPSASVSRRQSTWYVWPQRVSMRSPP